MKKLVGYIKNPFRMKHNAHFTVRYQAMTPSFQIQGGPKSKPLSVIIIKWY